jgi:phage shock protein A
MTVRNEVAGGRRRTNWYDRAPSTPEDGEFAQRAAYPHFPDQEALDSLREELRQHREHLAWLESDGHSLGQTASGLRKKIEQLEEQIESLRATGHFP